MFFLLSGEGVTDIGAGKNNAGVCEGDDFLVGPMAVIVDQVVEAIANAARTGTIGDGKIFILDIERAMRIRTGELDADAL